MVRADYAHLRELANALANDQVKGVLQYGHKKKLYHKLITIVLVLIRFLDKHNGKSL